VIAGSLRGRRMAVPPGLDVRPTGDRVMEALFDILGERVRGSRFLELFAGSGAVGIEAFSRGAAAIVFVESAREALAILEKNLRILPPASAAAVIRTPWPGGLGEALARLGSLPSAGRPEGALPESFTIVFADPPWSGAPNAEILESLSLPGLLATGALVILEHESRTPPPPRAGRLVLGRIAAYGRSSLAFYSPDPRDVAPPPTGT
jgi:16S rRNA (guanine966-N2)-methyltransferase